MKAIVALLCLVAVALAGTEQDTQFFDYTFKEVDLPKDVPYYIKYLITAADFADNLATSLTLQLTVDPSYIDTGRSIDVFFGDSSLVGQTLNTSSPDTVLNSTTSKSGNITCTTLTGCSYYFAFIARCKQYAPGIKACYNSITSKISAQLLKGTTAVSNPAALATCPYLHDTFATIPVDITTGGNHYYCYQEGAKNITVKLLTSLTTSFSKLTVHGANTSSIDNPAWILTKNNIVEPFPSGLFYVIVQPTHVSAGESTEYQVGLNYVGASATTIASFAAVLFALCASLF